MQRQKFEFSFDVFESIDELSQEDQQLLKEARRATENAYAPYSNFHVGAAAKLANGKSVTKAKLLKVIILYLHVACAAKVSRSLNPG